MLRFRRCQVTVNPGSAFNCYWEMPFRKKARFTLENIAEKEAVLYYQIDYTLTDVPKDAAYFHAQFRRSNPLPYKDVYTIVDGIEGWGQFVGTYMCWQMNNNGWWGEGEIKFYMDGDTEFPTICGTGTEDYFCGSYGFIVDKEYREYNDRICGNAPSHQTGWRVPCEYTDWALPVPYHGPCTFRERPPGDHSGARLAFRWAVSAASGRYIVRCILVPRLNRIIRSLRCRKRITSKYSKILQLKCHMYNRRCPSGTACYYQVHAVTITPGPVRSRCS